MQDEIPPELKEAVKHWNDPHFRSKRAWISTQARPLRLYDLIHAARQETHHEVHQKPAAKTTKKPKKKPLRYQPSIALHTRSKSKPIGKRTRAQKTASPIKKKKR